MVAPLPPSAPTAYDNPVTFHFRYLRFTYPSQLIITHVMVAVVVTIVYLGSSWQAPVSMAQADPASLHANAAGGPGTQYLFGVSDHPHPGNAQAVADLGAGWMRTDFAWDLIEPSPGYFTWTYYDNYVAQARAHGLKVLAILDNTAPWARDPACASQIKCAPASPVQYGQFAQAVAKHYQGRVAAYEIWNEPNITGAWLPATNPAAYTKLLIAAYPAIHNTDPGAVVVAGALAGAIQTEPGKLSAADFLNQIYADGGAGAFDAVSIHPYTYPDVPTDSASWQQLTEGPTSIHTIMAAHGDGAKTVWCTEFGAPTNGLLTDDPAPVITQHVSEAQQAKILIQAVTLWTTYPWAGPFFAYTTRDNAPSVNREHYFGLIRYDNSKKPAYYAYQWAIQEARNY